MSMLHSKQMEFKAQSTSICGLLPIVLQQYFCVHHQPNCPKQRSIHLPVYAQRIPPPQPPCVAGHHLIKRVAVAHPKECPSFIHFSPLSRFLCTHSISRCALLIPGLASQLTSGFLPSTSK